MLLRAVIREDMSMSMVDELITDIKRAVEYLDNHFTINIKDKADGQSVEVGHSSCCSSGTMSAILHDAVGPHAVMSMLPSAGQVCECVCADHHNATVSLLHTCDGT